MTWNVRYFSQGLGGLRTTWTHLRRVADAIAAARPDVVALQEVETRSLRGGLHPAPQLHRFVGALHASLARHGRPDRYRGWYFPAHRYAVGPAAAFTTGLAWVVRRPLDWVEPPEAAEVTHVRLPWLARLKQKRVVVHGRLALPEGPPLDLFQTHLSLPAFLEGPWHQVPERMGHGTNQIQEVGAVIRFARARRCGPALLMGDLNSAPDSPVLRALAEAGWVDPTPPAERATATCGFGPRRMHLDHLLATPDVRFQRYTVHSVDAGPFRGLSDHAPKIATLA